MTESYQQEVPPTWDQQALSLTTNPIGYWFLVVCQISFQAPPPFQTTSRNLIYMLDLTSIIIFYFKSVVFQSVYLSVSQSVCGSIHLCHLSIFLEILTSLSYPLAS